MYKSNYSAFKKWEHDIGKAPQTLMERVKEALTVGMGEIKKTSGKKYLSGPRPTKLQSITKKLWRSIKTKITSKGSLVTGTIGTDLGYGKVWEEGITFSRKGFMK